jgi:GTP-binding protein
MIVKQLQLCATLRTRASFRPDKTLSDTTPSNVTSQNPVVSYKPSIAPPTKSSQDGQLSGKNWAKRPIPVDKLAHYWETLAPTEAQLQYADKFFTRRKPNFLWSAPKFHSMSFGDSPEVCVLGRSNIGKSSLLNAIFGTNVAHSSSKPGRTRSMNAFGIGGDEHNSKDRLVVLDMPGYGHGGHAAWGAEIMKYLNQRKQLMRAFLLIDPLHGMKKTDMQLLTLFRQQNIPHQILFPKVDRHLFPSSTRLPSEGALQRRFQDLRNKMEDIAKAVQPDTEDESGALGEIIACSSEYKHNGKKLGIDMVRHAMLQAAGLEFQPPRKTGRTSEIVPYDQIPGLGQTSV